MRLRRLVALAAAVAARAARLRSACGGGAPCVGDDDGAYNRDLVDDARVVWRFGPRDPSRYLSVLDTGSEVWLAAREGAFESPWG